MVGKYWSGKIWIFSAYKYGITIDFRGGFQLTDLLTDKEKSNKSFTSHKPFNE